MDWLFSDGIYLLLFFVAVLAGFIDSIAGGGGLITIPALLSAGISPVQALATNKLQSVGGSFSATLYFIRRRVIDLKAQRFAIFMTFIGAVSGAMLVQFINPELLKQALPVLTIAIGLYFLLTPSIGAKDSKQRLGYYTFGVIIGGGIGFYDGVFGPGTGSFFALGYVMLLGYNLSKATAHAKLLNFTSNFGSLLFFILGGQVIWTIGLVMLCGQFIGARLGAGLVLTKGQKLIRPMLVIISFLMSIKLIHDNHSDTIALWFSALFN